MVSGLVTSPYDHDRICSGEARLILTALNSLISSKSILRGFGAILGRKFQIYRSIRFFGFLLRGDYAAEITQSIVLARGRVLDERNRRLVFI